jgi:hypothetical protein
MFAKFKKTGENAIFVNATLVRNYTEGREEGTTKLDFLGGESMLLPFSPQAVNGAFKRALAPVTNETAE